ncbi:hypothetical protein DL95DRAFT_422703 [Leptodontidium sp. 2 PMI_412]|nr:hypothetical protein DL95DRAFT_422703 [Leptodontidium sp. 2 PMI_412]
MVTVDPKGDGIALLSTSIVFLTAAWLTFVARLAVRVRRKAVGLDDHAMAAGLVLFTVTASLCIACSFYGSGQRADVLPASTKMKGIKAKFFYAGGVVIWGVMALSFLSAVAFIVAIANIYRPITTLWGETTTGSCNIQLNGDVSYFSAMEILTDGALALLPAVLLWNVQIRRRVKASVAVILGMGAVASCATIVRLRYLNLYNDPAEFMFGTGKIGLWSMVEEGIGISAGSLPALRPPRTGRFNGSADVRLDTFHQLPDDRDRDIDIKKHIMKETQFTMTSEPSETPAADWERVQALGWTTNKFTTQA